MPRSTFRIALLAMLCGASSATTAYAAIQLRSGDPAAPQEAAPSQALGDIVVTAQRRSERLQDVPMTVSALSADTLTKAGVTSTNDIARLTPAVTLPMFGTWLQPSVRGVTSTGANPGDSPNVAMYIDGVYQPQQIATLIDLPDVQQIEILKGPQGSLYGQNATGGAILVTFMSPSFDTAGMVSASYGNYDAVNIRGYVTGKLAEGVAASIAGGFQDRDGFRRHVVTGERDRGLRSRIVRGKLLFEPTETLKVTVSGYYSNRFDSAAYSGQPYHGNSVSYALFPDAPRPTSAKQFSAYPDVFTRLKAHGGSIRAELDVGAGTINSTTGYQRNKASYLADADYGPANFGFASTDDLSGEYFTQEVNFVSEKIGAFSVIAGGFYLTGQETYDTDEFYLTAPALPPAPLVDTFRQRRGLQLRKEVMAAYAEVTADLSDQLVLTAGGRYTYERQRAYNSVAFAGQPDQPLMGRPDGAETFSQFSPRVTARYALTSDANIYASFSKGFKSGMLNVTALADPPVKPETIQAYEAGFKGRIAPGVNFNVAGFWYDYKNLQVIAWEAPEYRQQNAANARIKGVEAELNLALGGGFSLNGGVAYLDAKYRDFLSAQVFAPTGVGNETAIKDLSGRRMLRSPKISGNLTANYEADTGFGHLGAFVSGYYNSGFGLEPENRVRQGKCATVDAELSLRPSRMDNVRFALWGKNLTDRAYLASALLSVMADGVAYAEPRTYGVRAELRF